MEKKKKKKHTENPHKQIFLAQFRSSQPPRCAGRKKGVSVRNREGFPFKFFLSYLMSHLLHKAYS